MIAESWTSGATEGLLEKFRRVLTEARKTALARKADGFTDGDVAVEYIKAMYSKFTSTLGESNANLDIRRPEWMHIIRSQAFANLWYKAYKHTWPGSPLSASAAQTNSTSPAANGVKFPARRAYSKRAASSPDETQGDSVHAAEECRLICRPTDGRTSALRRRPRPGKRPRPKPSAAPWKTHWNA